MEDGSEFSLRDALDVNHTGLVGRDKAPVLGSEHGSPISIRIEVMLLFFLLIGLLIGSSGQDISLGTDK
jgi:hypothetical protein